MMNFVAIFLVVSSLVSAGVWSPSPTPPNNQNQKQHHREVIVKNGDRVVVVEYDEIGQPNTKVSISSEQDRSFHGESSISSNDLSSPLKVTRSLHDGIENMKQAGSVLPSLGNSPKEIICDAYGKCKHEIANDIEMKKNIIKGTAYGAKKAAHKAGETVENAYEKAGEAVENVYGKAEDAYEKAGEAVGNVYEKAKETVADKAHEVEETAKGAVRKAKGTAKTAKDMGVTLKGDIRRNVSNQKEYLTEKAKETAEEAAEKVKEGAEELKSGTQKRFHRWGHKGREIWYGALRSTGAIDGLMSVAHLFGLATAYGMSMWITLVSSHVLSGNLAPQQFGMVQSKIYKVYFRAMSYNVGMALLGHLWGLRNKMFTGKAVDMLQNYNLLAALVIIFVNMLYLEPQSTKVIFERMKVEKEEGRGRERVHGVTTTEQHRTTTEGEPSTTHTPFVVETREQEVVQSDIDKLSEMRNRLKKLNSYSSLLNVMSLMALSWHLVYLSRRLHTSCC